MSYNSCLEADKYFQEFEKNKESLQKAWDFITKTANEALPCQNYNLLLSLIPYIEEGDGNLAFKYIGEARRLLRLLHIIELERKFQKLPFSIHCNTMNELMEKYLLTLFALRRLQFTPSESAVLGANFFLSQNKLSVFAIYTITQQDLIIPDLALYNRIAELYAMDWSIQDQELFTSLITQKQEITL